MSKFKPVSISPIIPEKTFRAFVQTVLPTIYDDSLSYYELLNKAVKILNTNTENVAILSDNQTKFIEAVTNYINSLEISVVPYDITNNFDAETFDEMKATIANGGICCIALLDTDGSKNYLYYSNDKFYSDSNQNRMTFNGLTNIKNVDDYSDNNAPSIITLSLEKVNDAIVVSYNKKYKVATENDIDTAFANAIAISVQTYVFEYNVNTDRLSASDVNRDIVAAINNHRICACKVVEENKPDVECYYSGKNVVDNSEKLVFVGNIIENGVCVGTKTVNIDANADAFLVEGVTTVNDKYYADKDIIKFIDFDIRYVDNNTIQLVNSPNSIEVYNYYRNEANKRYSVPRLRVIDSNNAITQEYYCFDSGITDPLPTIPNIFNVAFIFYIYNDFTGYSAIEVKGRANVNEWIVTTTTEYNNIDENYVNKSLMSKCELVTETSRNKWNPNTVQIGLIGVNGQIYTGGSYDNYQYNTITGVDTGDVITCYEFYNDRWVQKQIARVASFDANNNAVIDKGLSTGANTFTVPSGIKKLWVCTTKTGDKPFMCLINNEDLPTEFEEYGAEDHYYRATPDFLPKENIIINLPKNVYALVGYELNIYFENLVEDWEKYTWNVTCEKGMQLERCYRITPVSDDTGNYTISITVSNGKESKTVNSTLHIIPSSSNSGITKSVIILGDSTTNNGIAVTKLNENFNNDVMHIRTLGTRGTAPNMHEGRSGWTFNAYFNPPNAGDTANGVSNPWYNPTTQTFDANYYFNNTGVEKPDWLFINLGINDVFGYTDDEALTAQINNCILLCNSMITSIKNASTTNIGVCLTIPPNHSQDAFGKAYKCGQTRDRYKHNNTLFVNAFIKAFDNKESEKIYIIPINSNLDTIYNMGLESIPVNSRNTSITYQSPIANGGVHPVESGYWQIADVYTAFLKA